jgi:hypothetical protein
MLVVRVHNIIVAHSLPKGPIQVGKRVEYQKIARKYDMKFLFDYFFNLLMKKKFWSR